MTAVTKTAKTITPTDAARQRLWKAIETGGVSRFSEATVTVRAYDLRLVLRALNAWEATLGKISAVIHGAKRS